MKTTTVLQAGGKGWRHYFIITPDALVVFVDLTPAIAGWNIRKVEKQGVDCWPPEMTAADIVAWKLKNHDVSIVDDASASRLIDLVKEKGMVL